MKLKLNDQGQVVLQDGHPVYVYPDGKEAAINVADMAARFAVLEGDATASRQQASGCEAGVIGTIGGGKAKPTGQPTARQKIPTPTRAVVLPANAQFSDSRSHPLATTLQGHIEHRAGPWSLQSAPVLANRCVRLGSISDGGRNARSPTRRCRHGWRPGLRIARRLTTKRCRPISSAS